MIKTLLAWLTGSGILILSIIAGIIVGNYFPEFAKSFGPLGDIVMRLLKMCIIPILITSVSLSVLKLLQSQSILYLPYVGLLLVVSFLFASAVGILTATLLQPGMSIDYEISPTLKRASIQGAQMTRDVESPIQPQLESGLIQFINNAIPENLFSSLSQDRFFQVLIIAIFLGIALKALPPTYQNPCINLLEAARLLFRGIFSLITNMLPFAVFLGISYDISNVGMASILGMLNFVLSTYMGMLIIFIVCTVLMAFRLGISYRTVLSALKDPIVLSLVTNSAIATIPVTTQSLQTKLGVEKTIVEIIVSIGHVLFRYDAAFFFSFTAIFMAQFYNFNLEPSIYIYLWIMPIFISPMAVGVPGTIFLPFLSYILDPLGLPTSALVVLVLTIDPLLAPFRSATLIVINSTVIAFLQKSHMTRKHNAVPKAVSPLILPEG